MKPTNRLISTCCLLLALHLFSAAAAADPKFVGVRKCEACHGKELMGDQVATWRQGPHARAMRTLEGDAARAVALELGIEGPPQQSPACLVCHSTGFDLDAERQEYEVEVADAVQCESCHGPGADYRKKDIMSDVDEAHARGLWRAGEDPSVCTRCHNRESPTFDPQRFTLPDGSQSGFDFDQAIEQIQHPIPADVKGRYVELDDARKRAEKKARARR